MDYLSATGYFPEAFKEAIMVLIFKKYPRNYRPNSLLENTKKILEKIINKKLHGHLEEHELITKRQYGFRKRKVRQ